MTAKKRVTILLGGWSAERDVSLVSGRELEAALKQAHHDRYEISTLDPPRDPGAFIDALTMQAPDVVLNGLHGRGGEDGTIQALLNLMRIPYSHSGMLASALAMDKPLAKAVMRAAGLPVPDGRLVTRDDLLAGPVMTGAHVIKPPNEGSSVGLIIMQAQSNRRIEAHEVQDVMLVEPYIPGRELTVAIMGDTALGVLEIVANRAHYDYDAKYTPGGSDHLFPAPIHPAAYQEALDIALKAHQALGCRGVSRADLRYDDTGGEPGKLYILEVNTQPGMTPVSLLPDIARQMGISFADLAAWMVENAACDA